MKLILIIIIGCNFNLKAQTEWVIRDSTNFDYIITTEINDQKITGKTRENALIDYVGDSKFSLAKAMTSIKFPEIVHFEAIFNDGLKKDFKGSFNRLFSERKMEGSISVDSILITLFSADNKQTETITGVKKNPASIIKDYTLIVNNIINLTEEKIYDPGFIQSKEWKDFREIMLNNSRKIKDNLELQIGFLAIARDFPFTHYYLLKNTNNIEESNNFTIKEINSNTCVLDIDAFAGKREKMDSLINMVDTKKYDNLIVDLRDNRGGNHEAAAPLMEFIVSKETIIGIFPNKKWYEDNDRFPTINEYEKFNEFNSGTLDEFYKTSENGYGLFLKCIPSKRHFNGKVFVIINKNTGSASEIFALALKENKLATIVGQNTAGAVLGGKVYDINEDFHIVIPQNDYISFLGYRIDKKGVKPDVVVENEDEIEYVLKNLIKM